MREVNRLTLFAVSGVALLALGATACGSGTSSGSAAPSPAGTSGATRPAPSNGAAAATLSVAGDPALGSRVTDSKGRTLYRFDKDGANPPASHCSGQCATLWPAATVNGAVSLKGIDKALVGTLTRSDGTKQLTLHGWPLYTFSGDTKAGDTKGQGVGGIWFAATPQGGKAHAAPSHDASDDKGSDAGSGSSGGYSY